VGGVHIRDERLADACSRFERAAVELLAAVEDAFSATTDAEHRAAFQRRNAVTPDLNLFGDATLMFADARRTRSPKPSGSPGRSTKDGRPGASETSSAKWALAWAKVGARVSTHRSTGSTRSTSLSTFHATCWPCTGFQSGSGIRLIVSGDPHIADCLQLSSLLWSHPPEYYTKPTFAVCDGSLPARAPTHRGGTGITDAR
jgi:hypothetical protein